MREVAMRPVGWETIRVQFCHRVGQQVSLEVQLVHPAEVMPDQPPRVLAHRCSLGTACNLFDKPACIWSGTQPEYDPLA